MFHQQARLLEELALHLKPEAVAILRQLFGDPRGIVEAKGPLVVRGSRRPDREKAEWGDLHIGARADAKFEGRALGTLRWCRAESEWTSQTNPKTGVVEFWVYCRECSKDGVMSGPLFPVRLIVTGGQEPDVDLGDMLAYGYALDGTRISFPSSAPPYYATIQTLPTGELATATQPPPLTLTPEPAAVGIRRRNLLYHVHPTRENDAWRQNVRQIVRRMRLFNGRRLVGVMTGPGLEPLEAVAHAFAPWAVELVPIPNEPLRSECATFRALLPLLYSLDPSEATFFAHTKGTWNRQLSPLGIMYWRNALYHHLLDDFAGVERLLEDHAAVGGCLLVLGKGRQRFPSGLRHGSWHYSGTFFWFRHDQVFSHPQWSEIPHDRYGAEAYLGGLLPVEEAATVYQPSAPEKEGRYYDPEVHPDRLADPPLPPMARLHVGTAITLDYVSRALGYLESLHRMPVPSKFCVCLGFLPSEELRARFPSIRFIHRARDCVESYGMIQHGPWLDVCPWIADGDLCVFTDADMTIQRGFSEEELSRFASYDDRTLGLGLNAGPHDTLQFEADRTGFSDPSGAYPGPWSQIPVYNCGVIIARASLFRQLRAAYDAEAPRFHAMAHDRARCQWLICYLVHRAGWKVDRLGREIHTNGHFGVPPDCHYDAAGRLIHDGKLVLFRHTL